MAMLNLVDLAKSKGNDPAIGLIEEVIKEVPEMTVIPARSVAATSYKSLTRTALPTVGFRGYNQGTDPTKSSYAQKEHAMLLLSGRSEADIKAAEAWEGGAAEWIALESQGMALAALIKLGTQTFYGRGTGGDSTGFPGLKEFTPFGGDRTLNAAGTTVGGTESVYFVKFGLQAVHHIFGQSRVLTLSDPRIGDGEDSDGKKFPAYISTLDGYAGLHIGSIYSAGRIANLTVESNKSWTDSMTAEMLTKFPTGWKPDAIFCSRRQLWKLQTSRTAVQYNGKQVADIPTESMGIPIYQTDSIGITDAVEA